MEWTTDVARGDWIRERLDDRLPASIHALVPRGFEAYARVLHPATRERPVGAAWPPEPVERHRAEWDAFSRAGHSLDSAAVTWAETADAFDSRVDPRGPWHELVGFDESHSGEQARDDAGWRYTEPEEGRLDAASLASIVRVLARFTGTGDDIVAGIWDGWGGVLGFMGSAPSRATLTLAGSPAGTDDDERRRHAEFLAQSIHDPFNSPFAKVSWQPGILSEEISRGPRLALPSRDHVLFRASLAEFAQPSWAALVPWADEVAEWTASPSLVWPADRAWVLATDVDLDSTLIAGSAALVDALRAAPALETVELPEGAALRP
ncbi:hypothetical protein [Agromyces atrinae]|uniref:Uncharacterized protein n=1 Tax=Agromyces atrinae TaxID=592376 RepID=A0A4Q2M4W3_9MICO|nr:hypothetical protein [Agromyces atrinae]NYD67270.1 hypothetical protein [Agromyces atrinae]RXZ86898.1 hypothetical protein ESP50_07495 [Agromyces atrinae]